LGDDVRDALHAYLAGIFSHHDCICVEINSVADHIHCLLRLSKTLRLAKVVEQMKTGSNHWHKERGYRDFAWQSGYGAFSVS
jgi:REP element-mobilizing transposase RayT